MLHSVVSICILKHALEIRSLESYVAIFRIANDVLLREKK